MSTRDLHEYVPGQFQQLTRYIQEPAGADAGSILDVERVRLAGYDIELWDASSGGVQLIEGTDYTLEFKDQEISDLEGFDVNAGYMIINPAYQAVNLYLTAKIVGGYTFRPYRPQMLKVSVDTVLTMDVIADMAVMVDTTAGDVIVTLPEMSSDVLAENSQVTIIPTGGGTVIITHSTFLQDFRINDTAAAFIYAAGTWLQLGGSGGGTGGGMAVGEVAWWPGAGVPDRSKLVCDGTLYNPADYPSLFAKLGTLYGGDGVATFGVPNLSGITPGAFGTRVVNGRTKGDGTAIGGIREDQDQLVQGSFDLRRFSPDDEAIFGAYGAFQNNGFLAGVSAEFNNSSDTSYGQRITLDSALTTRTGAYSRSTELVGRWVIQAYDTVQEVPGDPAVIKDWVLVYSGPAVLTVVNQWGEGVFIIGFQYTYQGALVLSNVTMGVLIDGNDRNVLFDIDQTGADSFIRGKYVSATNNFTLQAIGTDFTNPLIRGIYKFDDAAVSGAVLNPPVDGWETVYDNPSNYGDVVNTWGAGTYEIISDSDATAITGGLTFIITLPNLYGLCQSTNYAYSATQFLRAVYSNVTNNFLLQWTGTAGSTQAIKRIRKFTGMLNVIHTYQATIEEVDTTARDVAIVLPSAPSAGYQKTYVNIGTTGFKVTGIPDGIKLGGNKSLTITWGGSLWSYEDVCIDSYKKTGTNSEEQRVEKYASGRMNITCDFNTFATSRIFTFVESFVGVPIPIAVTARHSAGLGAMQVVGDGYPTITQIQVITGTGTAHDYTWQVQGRWN